MSGTSRQADIFDAIQAGDVAAVTLFLEADKKLISAKDREGRQPLHVAAMYGRLEIAKLLLERKAKVDAKNKQHRTALHLAAINGESGVAQFLKQRGAEVNIHPKNNWSALHECLSMNNPRGALLLAELGSDPNLVAKYYGNTVSPLHQVMAGSGNEFLKAPGIRRQITEALLSRGADAGVRDGEGETALHLAAKGGFAGCVEALLEKGAELDARDPDGATPLFFAVLGGNLRTVRLLLDRGADVNVTLSPNAEHFAGATPLGMARRLGHRHVARLLQERGGVDPEPVEPAAPSHAEIHSAAWEGHLDDVRAILDEDPTGVAAVAPMGMITGQPLHKAATAGHVEVVKLLLERGAPLDNDRGDCYTPLHDAVVQNHPEIVRLLLRAGANADQNAGHRPPLQEAAYWLHREVIQALLEGGADPNVKNDRGQSPLWVVLNKSGGGWRDIAQHDDARQRAACADLLRAAGGHE